MNDPLRELIVDSAEVDRGRLMACLKGRAGVDSKTGEPVLLDGFWELKSARKKILCYLLDRKAAVVLGKAEIEGAGPTKISDATGIARGTVGRTLRELVASRILIQDGRRLYSVPSHQLLVAAGELSDGDG